MERKESVPLGNLLDKRDGDSNPLQQLVLCMVLLERSRRTSRTARAIKERYFEYDGLYREALFTVFVCQ